MAAVIAKATATHLTDAGPVVYWTGVVRESALVVPDTSPWRDLDSYTTDPFGPAHLGRALVEDYWALDADFDEWTLRHIVNPLRQPGNKRVTNLRFPEGIDWVYVADASWLTVMYRSDINPQLWFRGTVRWCDDPGRVQLVLEDKTEGEL